MVIGVGWLGRSNRFGGGGGAYDLCFLFSAPFADLFISGGGLEEAILVVESGYAEWYAAAGAAGAAAAVMCV